MNNLERLVLDYSRQMLFLVDPENMQIVLANRTAWQTLGFAEEDLLGKSITEVESSLPDVFYWEDVRSGQYNEIELQEGLYLCGDGSLLPVTKSVRAVAHSGRTFLLLQAQDIREQRRVEDDLAQAMSQMRATIESTGDGIMVMNLQGGIASMNRLFSRMWSIPEDLLLARDDAHVINVMVAQLVDGAAWRGLLQPTVDATETKDLFHLKDGRVFECKSRPQFLDEGVIGHVFSCSDITDRIRIERELTEALDRAKEASRAKTRFLGTMSHELRTPMNAILGFSHVLQSQGLPTQQEILTRKIVEASERLLLLLNGIIDYAKLEGGGDVHVQVASFDLAKMLHDASTPDFALARAKGLNANLDCDPGLPAHVQGDSRIIERVLAHFISNAVKFTALGSIRLTAARMASQPDDRVRLRFSVSDTGIGISPENQAKLFQPFMQADDSIDRKFEGIGLGLALARELAAVIGGEIGVESEPDKGSTFWLEVTLRIDDSIAPASAPDRADAPGALPQGAAAGGPMPGNIRATMKLLDKLLRAYDTRAATLLAKAEPRLRPWLGDRFDTLSESIDAFDYDQACLLLDEMRGAASDAISLETDTKASLPA